MCTHSSHRSARRKNGARSSAAAAARRDAIDRRTDHARANLLDAAAAAAGIDDDKQLEPYETMGDFAAECKRIQEERTAGSAMRHLLGAVVAEWLERATEDHTAFEGRFGEAIGGMLRPGQSGVHAPDGSALQRPHHPCGEMSTAEKFDVRDRPFPKPWTPPIVPSFVSRAR